MSRRAQTGGRLAAALLALALAGTPWSFAAAETAGDAEAAARLAPFKAALMQALGRGLASGPVAAIDTCRLEAPALARDAQGPDMRLGRTSDRLRNPANTAPAWVAPLLADYLAGAPRTPRSVPLADRATGYVEPIVVKPMCLACHGTAVAREVRAALAAHYPDDRATGYAVGDLRGVFWVETRAAE